MLIFSRRAVNNCRYRPFFSILLGAALLTGSGCTATMVTGSNRQDLPVANLATGPGDCCDDYVFDANIKTVQLYRSQDPLSYPALRIVSDEFLTLEFDEIIDPNGQRGNFIVEYVHCDYNWTPTGILPIEFYNGFPQQRIDNFTFSEFTKVNYIHYQFQFPQQGENFKLSGNYLLRVYRDEGNRKLLFTRRFVVFEPRVGFENITLVNSQLNRQPLNELRFLLAPSADLPIFNPALELKVQVLQNWRWERAQVDLQPLFQREGRLEYRIRTKDFGGGNEFRFADLRSTRLYGETTRDVEETENYYVVTLKVDEPRLNPSVELGARFDLNGGYVIDVQEFGEAYYQADYVMTRFRLRAPEQAGPVYVQGRMAVWAPMPDFQLDYDAVSGRYEGEVLLKQGYYDYTYLTVVEDEKRRIFDEETIETVLPATENYYGVLVYYKAPIDRAHRLIGYFPVNY